MTSCNASKTFKLPEENLIAVLPSFNAEYDFSTYFETLQTGNLDRYSLV